MKNESCNRCPLAVQNNFKSVKPRGKIDSKLFIVGEAPGHKEQKTGYTFVGKSGMYLQRFIDNNNLTNYCYITNVVKCRPPFNRTPTWTEINSCKPRFINEIKEGKPRIILLLGNTAVNAFFNREINNITKLHGKHIKIGNTYVLFGYHPSHVLMNKEKEDSYSKLFNTVAGIYRILINKYI